MRRRKRNWVVTLSAMPALMACPAWAAKWDIVPTLRSELTYTDNVSLSRAGTERSDWVTQVTPGVSVNATGARLRFNSTYGAQILHRERSGGGGINHQFSANGNVELVRQLLFLDARAGVGQQNTSLLAPQTDSNVNNTGNRTNVRTFFISPYLRRDFGQSARGELRVTHSTVSTSAVAGSTINTGFGKSVSNGLSARISSGPAFKLYTWDVSYSNSNVDSNQPTQPSVSTETITASGKRLVTAQIAVTSSVGYETSDYAAVGNSPKGSFWNAGFEWSPTPRTRLAASTGKRYFGTNRSFDFSHRTRLTTWGAGYNESVTTTHSQAVTPSSITTAGYLDTLFRSSIPDAAARQLAVDSFISQNALPTNLTVPLNFLTTQTILVKRLQASFGIHGVRNTVLTNLFSQSSESVAAGVAASGAGDFASSSTVKQTGGSVLWNWRFGTRSSANLGASYTQSEFPTLGRLDDVQTINLGVTHQFQPKISGTLNYRGLKNESNTAGAGHTENAVSAALNLRF